MAHTLVEQVGERAAVRPALPDVEGVVAGVTGLLDFLEGAGDYQEEVLLSDRQGRPLGSIRVYLGRAFLEHDLERTLGRGLWTALAVGLIAVLSGIALHRLASRRVRVLAEGVAALREGRLPRELPESGLDEFDRLARELNLLGRSFQSSGTSSRSGEDAPLQPAAELLGNGIVLVDAGGVLLFSNQLARQRLGLGGEVDGRRVEELLDSAHPLRRLLAYLAPREAGSRAVRLPGDGSGSWVAVGHRIQDPAGVLVEFKRERELAEIHLLVDQSRVLQRLGEMAAGVAHELRGPLQGIHLDLDALGRTLEDEPEEARRLATDLHAKVQRLEWVVRGFLKVARLRPLSVEPLAVDEVLEEVQEQMAASALMAGLRLRLDLPEERLETSGDPEVLGQAIQNLVGNALQALPSRDGEVVLRARGEQEAIRIEIEDSGPGIPDDIAERVFELYFTTREQGTGVGLALVRQTAELHRGSCFHETAPGGGARFVLRLPRQERAALLPEE
jgi:signal transduction histidine kinase